VKRALTAFVSPPGFVGLAGLAGLVGLAGLAGLVGLDGLAWLWLTSFQIFMRLL